MPDGTLTSLAILKVNWDESRTDFIDVLVPFVIEHLRVSQVPVVSLSELQQGLGKKFGLSPPQNTVRTVLGRAARRGYLKREHGIYRPVRERLNDLQFTKAEQYALAMHNLLVSNVIRFCAEYFNESIDVQTAESMLLRYLNEFDVDMLSTTLLGAEVQLPPATKVRSRYLIGSFVSYISQHDPAVFEALETVVKGHMLANFVFFSSQARLTASSSPLLCT